MIGLLYQFPTWMQHLYRGVTWRRDASVLHDGKPVVYLTFDDGPIPEVTPAILDILAHYGVKATFFVVGDNVHKYPQIFTRLLSDGHRVGNHTFHHIKGTKFSTPDYLQDIAACQHAMTDTAHSSSEQITPLLLREGQGGGLLFRPPYGKMTFRQKRAVRELGYEVILWDVLTHDYNRSYSPEQMLAIVRRYTRAGSIINFHDSVKSADRTIAALPMVIEWLQAQGYAIQTL